MSKTKSHRDKLASETHQIHKLDIQITNKTLKSTKNNQTIIYLCKEEQPRKNNDLQGRQGTKHQLQKSILAV